MQFWKVVFRVCVNRENEWCVKEMWSRRNCIEYDDRIAFHPGYYINEIIEERGLTREDFAQLIGIAPNNLRLLIRGEQSLSADVATKLSRITGTSVSYWTNLQNAFDDLRELYENK